jgi:hypothetical protein
LLFEPTPRWQINIERQPMVNAPTTLRSANEAAAPDRLLQPQAVEHPLKCGLQRVKVAARGYEN